MSTTEHHGRVRLTRARIKWARDCRAALGIAQSEAAEKTGMSRGNLDNIEAGRYTQCTAATWIGLTKFYTAQGCVVPPPEEEELPEESADEDDDPSRTALAEKLQALKERLGVSWASLAVTLKVSLSMLQRAAALKDRRKPISPDSQDRLWKGIARLESIPKRAVAQGLVDPPKPEEKPNDKMEVSSSASIVATLMQPSPTPQVYRIPSTLELDLRELEIIARIRPYAEAIQVGAAAATSELEQLTKTRPIPKA